MEEGKNDRLDRLEAQLDDHRKRLDEHERALCGVRERPNDPGACAGASVSAGTLLAVLGLTAVTGTGTAAAQDATGQVGTGPRPVKTVYTAALNGPLTGGVRVESVVGNGLEVQNGALTLTERN